ncbi:unnamed protein product [Schistosoma mattheei]|uniref:Uncharacterized protein n=1 Tax=Schistosoma mattheei TaxID=31246 RepID=A0A183P993_9TREM|nr:unnamed protein product [Schistosoma mattheei]
MTKKDVKSDENVAHFLTFIGREAYSLIKTLAYPEKPISLPYATLKELLLNHVKCTSFECHERAKFHEMIRQNDQKVREFILELPKQAAKCIFGGRLHVQLRDQLIAGINIPCLEKELLRMTNCSFQDATAACINYEAVNQLGIQSVKISNNLLSRHDEIQSQDQSNLRLFNSDSYSRLSSTGNQLNPLDPSWTEKASYGRDAAILRSRRGKSTHSGSRSYAVQSSTKCTCRMGISPIHNHQSIIQNKEGGDHHEYYPELCTHQ